MRGNDGEVIDACLAWAAAGHRFALLTVLTTYGASPRPAGALAAIRDDGRIVGSVSGGCVEDDLVDEVRGGWLASAERPLLRVFGRDAGERARYRLPCGNTLRVAVEPRCDLEQLAQIQHLLHQQKLVRREVDMTSGASRLREVGEAGPLEERARGFAITLGPRYRALLIGCGEIGRYLAPLLGTLGFSVALCDPRAEYADGWDLTDAPVSRAMPDDWIVAQAADARSAVLALSHDPKLDDLALMEALKTPAFYVGAVGSAANNAARRQRLLEFGVTAAEAARLHGPIGLDIGSRTPAEIAVSIAADLIAHLRRPAAACATANARLPSDRSTLSGLF